MFFVSFKEIQLSRDVCQDWRLEVRNTRSFLQLSSVTVFFLQF